MVQFPYISYRNAVAPEIKRQIRRSPIGLKSCCQIYSRQTPIIPLRCAQGIQLPFQTEEFDQLQIFVVRIPSTFGEQTHRLW